MFENRIISTLDNFPNTKCTKPDFWGNMGGTLFKKEYLDDTRYKQRNGKLYFYPNLTIFLLNRYIFSQIY